MNIKTLVILGCGGVTSHILPALIHQFNVILVDGDKYEPKNVTRQLAAHVGDGKNKAEVLRDIYKDLTDKEITAIPQYLDKNTDLPPHDVLLVAVDNHDARIAAEASATRHFVPMIWGANEEFDPQAFMWLPDRKDTWHNPITRMDIQPDGRSPLGGCNTQAALDEKPQLAIANNVAGGLMLLMLHALQNVMKEDNLPAQLIGTNTGVTTMRFKDIPESKPSTAIAADLASKF